MIETTTLSGGFTPLGAGHVVTGSGRWALEMVVLAAVVKSAVGQKTHFCDPDPAHGLYV